MRGGDGSVRPLRPRHTRIASVIEQGKSRGRLVTVVTSVRNRISCQKARNCFYRFPLPNQYIVLTLPPHISESFFDLGSSYITHHTILQFLAICLVPLLSDYGTRYHHYPLSGTEAQDLISIFFILLPPPHPRNFGWVYYRTTSPLSLAMAVSYMHVEHFAG